LDTLQFSSPERADYTANRLMEFLDRLHHYATEEEPADLDQAKDMLAGIAEVTKNMTNQVLDTHDQMMVGNIPAEAFENDGGGAPGFLLPVYAEANIRYWRLRKSGGDAV
jgi:hypothetical protein